MPFTYNNQQKVVENIESGIQKLCGEQDVVNKRVTSKQRRYDQLNRLAYDKTASDYKRGDAVAKRAKAWGEWKAAEALQDALPVRIHAEEFKLNKARKELSKMKPPVSKARMRRDEQRPVAQSRTRTRLLGRSYSREAQKIRERQKNATRVAKPDAPAFKKKRIEVQEPECDFKGTARGRAAEIVKSRKRERSEAPDEISQPTRMHKRARHRHVVYSDDESDDATGGRTQRDASIGTPGGRKDGTLTVQRTSPSVAGIPPRGNKRKDESSADGVSAPVSKKAKINLKYRNSNTNRSEPAEKDSPATNSPETSYRQSTSSEGDKTRVSDTSASSVTVESAGDKPSSGGRTEERPFKGIVTIGNSCFSSAVIQLLDAAVEGEDLDRFLGKLVEIEKFGVTDKECRKMDKMFASTRHNREKINKARKFIREYAGKDADMMSVAKHLRKLLEDLRAGDKNVISAFHFQSVVAEGGQDKAARKARQRMNGDTQQDASEYFTVTMNALKSNPSTQDAHRLSRLFDIETETLRRCPECEHESIYPEPNSDHHTVHVDDSVDFVDLQRAFESSKHSVTEIDCLKCTDDGQYYAHRLTSFTKFVKTPDNLIVSIGRLFRDKRGQTQKSTAKIGLDEHKFSVGDATYGLSAAIMHRGRNADFGHYFIFRKHGEDWYRIDDKVVTKVSKEVVADSKNCQSAMLLFKKQQS